MTGAIGFIGLGVMGEPICRNLARKTGTPVFGFDRADERLQRLEAVGVTRAASLAELAKQCDVIFMALPSGKHVAAVCDGDDGGFGNATGEIADVHPAKPADTDDTHFQTNASLGGHV